MNNNEILAKNVQPGQQAFLAGYWLDVENVYIDDYEVFIVATSVGASWSSEYIFGLAATVEVRN